MPGGPGTAARASSRNVSRRSGRPRTWTAPPSTTRSPASASSSAAATRTTFARTLRAASSAAGRATEAPRLAKPPTPNGTCALSPWTTVIAFGGHGELVGHDLGQRRLDPLPHRGHAGVDDDVAGGVHLDARVLPRPEPGLLHHAADPDPEVAPVAAARRPARRARAA